LSTIHASRPSGESSSARPRLCGLVAAMWP
jgi:hypothetical protein